MSLEPPSGVMQDPGLNQNTKRWISELYKVVSEQRQWQHLETLDTTSGASVTTTEIFPSNCTAIRLVFDGISTSGTNNIIIQLGTSGGLVTSGYTGAANRMNNTSPDHSNRTDGFDIRRTASGDDYIGIADIQKTTPTSTEWVYSYVAGDTASSVTSIGGSRVDAAGTVTQLKILLSGADSFDAGAVDIWYYG